jgi:hypothetical protein
MQNILIYFLRAIDICDWFTFAVWSFFSLQKDCEGKLLPFLNILGLELSRFGYFKHFYFYLWRHPTNL